MPSQRITVAKIGGLAADIVLQRMQEWSAARQTNNPNEWSPDQWPQPIRAEADAFANQLRAHAFAPPVVHFVEWADTWSMGDLFRRWLTPPDGPMPLAVFADQHEIFVYSMPDGGRLARHLVTVGPQQWTEANWFIARLHEAVETWQELVERALLVVLRYVVASSALDEEVTTSLQRLPDWLS